MEDILKLLGVTTQAEAISKLTNLLTQTARIPGLEQEITNFQKKEIETRIDNLIRDRKLTQAQKDWALNLATTAPISFETYVSSLIAAPEGYSQEEAGLRVQQAIDQQKLLPSLKENMIKLGIENKAALDEFLNSLGAINLGKPENLDNPTADPVAGYKVKVVE